MLIDQNTLKGLIHTANSGSLVSLLTIAENYIASGIATVEWGYRHWLSEGNKKHTSFFGSNYYETSGGYVPNYPVTPIVIPLEGFLLEDGNFILLEDGCSIPLEEDNIDSILMENGEAVLQENGSFILV